MAMNWWEALVLAVIQGTTEWLPVSSSGHLLLAEELLGLEGSVGYLLLLHAGTLLAVVLVYRERLLAMLRALLGMPRDAAATSWTAALRAHPDRLLAAWVLLGTIPIVVVGLILREVISAWHTGTATLWFDFLVTALLLMRASLVRGATRTVATMRAKDAWIIGAYQVLSLLPAVSRSGATLAGAVERRLSWKDAADYAFLLSIPALAGAMLLEWRSFGALAEAGWLASGIGFGASAVVGYATIRWLLSFLRHAKPWMFAVYCGGLGLGLLAVRLA